MNWSKLTERKLEGGLGFHDFRAFNMAFLSEQGWRVLQNLDSLMVRTLRTRYFPYHNVLNPKKASI